MPLYASDGTEYIYAFDAAPNGSYRCIECNSPLKIRRGKSRVPHFYHIRTTPSCRLYSKGEDHLLIQLQIQRLLGPKEAQMEAPFLKIHRIADILWEKEKIVFEIQCSSIYEKEAETRIRDYQKMGYEIIWLLDDRLFNRKTVRPAEFFLRSRSCYFVGFQKNGLSLFYDQLEIIREKKRIRKSRPLAIDLKKIENTPNLEWPPFLPKQITRRIENQPRYCKGDLIDRAIQSALSPFVVSNLKNWRRWEEEAEAQGNKGEAKDFFKNEVIEPYMSWLEKILIELP